MNEKMLLFFIVLALVPMPYDFYLLYRAKFKSLGLEFMSEVTEIISGTLKTNNWSFDQRYVVEGFWGDCPVKITLGTRNLEFEFHSAELPKANLFLLKYPKYENGVIQVGKRLHKYVRSSGIWNKSYSISEFSIDLNAIQKVSFEIKAAKNA